MNLINRDKLIKALEEEIRAGNEYLKDNPNEKCEELYLKGVRYALIVALSQPQVNQWIPCKERLPKEDGKYLTTCEGIEIAQIRLFEGEWDSIAKVIAWCELPKPYEEKENVD